MKTAAIPAWTADGVLPPIGGIATARDRSPYRVSLTDYLLRFGGTPDRCAILKGLLDYRARLHNAGLIRGFQWLDGSFLENVEVTENRSPNDIDLVSFYYCPPGISQAALLATHPWLVDRHALKTQHRVDAYVLDLGNNDPETLTRQSAYWYSMWSHRRNRVWKGFVEIDLAPADDAAGAATLASLSILGGAP